MRARKIPSAQKIVYLSMSCYKTFKNIIYIRLSFGKRGSAVIYIEEETTVADKKIYATLMQQNKSFSVY